MTDIKLRDSKVTFKLDSSADVTAIPEQVFKRIWHRDEKLEVA